MKLMILICMFMLPALSGAQVEPAASTKLESSSRAAIIEQTIEILRREYVFAEVADEIGALLRRELAFGAYDEFAEPRAFAVRLTADLRRVNNDQHLGMLYEPPPPPNSEVAFPSPTPFDPEVFVNYGFERVERLPGNIGYIDLRGFMAPSGAAKACAAAMNFLANTDALIVDLRYNRGGSADTVALISSYLFEERTHLSDIYERRTDRTEEQWTTTEVLGQRYGRSKDVYALVSRGTFSAAEDFAYSLQMLKRVKIVGEATGGGAHPVIGRSLGNGLVLRVPYAESINPVSHSNWEGVGVRPDVAVPAVEALNVAHGLLLEQVAAAAKNLNPIGATILEREIRVNAAALVEQRLLHEHERSLRLSFVKSEPGQLRGSIEGQVAREFLSVLNTGSLAAMRRFRERHSMNITRYANDYALYEQTGGFKVHSVVDLQEAGSVSVLVQGVRDAGWRTITFDVDEVAPHPILRLDVQPAPKPRS